MVAAAAALEPLGLVDDALERAVLVLRVQVAHAALRDQDLDFAVQRVAKVLREVHGEAVRVFDEFGVDEDLPWLAEVEREGVLLEELAVGFGTFAAHCGGGVPVGEGFGKMMAWIEKLGLVGIIKRTLS